MSASSSATTANWTEPGRHEVAPGVFRVPLPVPDVGLKAVNVYVFAAGDGLTLVDGGWDDEPSRQALVAGLATLGHELGDVDRFLVTHAHADHYSQASAVAASIDATLHLGIDEAPSLAMLLAEEAPAFTWFGRLRRAGAGELVPALRRAGFPDPGRRPTFAPPHAWLEDGDEVAGPGGSALTVLATPGHTRGHVVFDHPTAASLFAGDHVLPHITPSIGFEPRPSRSPLADYLDSLARVRAMPDRRVLPAHGPPTDSAHARVDELLEHHRVRLGAMRAAIVTGGVGGSTAFDVAHRVGWTRRERAFDTLDPFNQLLATTETAAHLEVLVARGALRVTRGEVDTFAPTAHGRD